jgi:hypothetical protein
MQLIQQKLNHLYFFIIITIQYFFGFVVSTGLTSGDAPVITGTCLLKFLLMKN